MAERAERAMSVVRVRPLEAAGYTPHVLHREGQAWVEKNCYIDVWIEALHALDLEPLAMLPFTLTTRFEGDQWTFFKPPHADLLELYGVDVHELNVWRPLLEHAVHHARTGNFVFTEADSFYLPDTSGTDYRQNHVKSTIVLNDVDVDARRLGYFHNASYYELAGADFAAIFRLNGPMDAHVLPLFAEFARLDRVVRHPVAELARRSAELGRKHLAARPLESPFTAYRARFAEDIQRCRGEGLAFYHQYAFATVRQCGANFELAARWLAWLAEHGEGLDRGGLEEAASRFIAISEAAKALILKGARAVNGKRAVDFSEMFDAMSASYDAAMGALVTRLGVAAG
jgi:hypothetical protein